MVIINPVTVYKVKSHEAAAKATDHFWTGNHLNPTAGSANNSSSPEIIETIQF